MAAERAVAPPGVEIDQVVDWLVVAKSELNRDGVVTSVPEVCLCGSERDDCSPIFDWDDPNNYDKGAEIVMRCECPVVGGPVELAFTLKQRI